MDTLTYLTSPNAIPTHEKLTLISHRWKRVTSIHLSICIVFANIISCISDILNMLLVNNKKAMLKCVVWRHRVLLWDSNGCLEPVKADFLQHSINTPRAEIPNMAGMCFSELSPPTRSHSWRPLFECNNNHTHTGCWHRSCGLEKTQRVHAC